MVDRLPSLLGRLMLRKTNYSGRGSMPINRLYRSLPDLLVQLPPEERKTRTRNFSWLLVGLFLSRWVHLSKIANKIPTTKATLPSAVRRLSRLVDNASIRLRECYEPLA